jgi:hypothetical protein
MDLSFQDTDMSQIKSKDRVRNLAEVYTNEREVNAMLDLIPLRKPDDIISYRYLEPACGNGNFLIEILRRKLKRINDKYANKSVKEYEFYIARALTTIYGIDICPENVSEARNRLFTEVKATFDTHKGSFECSDGFLSLIDYLLMTNIVLGDSINAPEKIIFTEFKMKHRSLTRYEYCFADMTQDKPEPIRALEAQHFLNIGFEHEQQTGRRHEGKQGHLNLI